MAHWNRFAAASALAAAFSLAATPAMARGYHHHWHRWHRDRVDGDMQRRVVAIETDLEREPAAIEALYEVRMVRLTPVGVVVSLPRSWT